MTRLEKIKDMAIGILIVSTLLAVALAALLAITLVFEFFDRGTANPNPYRNSSAEDSFCPRC